MRKTQHLLMYACLRFSSQALRCYKDVKQALQEAIKQAYKQDIKQAYKQDIKQAYKQNIKQGSE
jgi:hypothetical protein